ncbi:MAG: oligosaccharide flippase family protein [Clostridia bacterium]|nr:oligosaccharide flippase family protein [Clostridia bacterium]
MGNIKRVQKYFLNGILLALATIFLRGIGVTFNAYITSKIGAEGMGIITLIGSVYGFSLTVATSGINLCMVRLISASYKENYGIPDKNSYTSLGKILRNGISYALIFSLTATVALLISAENIGTLLLKDYRTIRPLRVLALTLPLIAISSTLNGYFCGVQRVYKNVIAQICEQGIKIIAVISLFLCLADSVEDGCMAVICGGAIAEVGSTIVYLLLYIFDRKKHGFSEKISQKRGYVTHLSEKSHNFSEVFSLAFPVAISAYVRSALSTVEHLIIPFGLRKNGADFKSALASYGVLHGMVIPLLYFPSAILSAFSSLLVPELSSSQAEGHRKRIKYIVGRVISVTLLFSLLVAGIFMAFSHEIGILMYKSAEASRYIRLLAPLIPLMYLDMATDTMLKGLGEQIYSMRVNIADSLISIILLLTLLPTLGIEGYVSAIFITELFNTSASLIRLLNITGLCPSVSRWVIKPLAVIIISTFIIRHIFSPTVTVSYLRLSWEIILTAAVYLVFSVLTGAISRADIRWARSIIKKE